MIVAPVKSSRETNLMSETIGATTPLVTAVVDGSELSAAALGRALRAKDRLDRKLHLPLVHHVPAVVAHRQRTVRP
jgi:hypothetical protein